MYRADGNIALNHGPSFWGSIIPEVIDFSVHVTVASDLVAFWDNFFDQIDVSFSNTSDNEKGCFDVLGIKDFKDCLCVVFYP